MCIVLFVAYAFEYGLWPSCLPVYVESKNPECKQEHPSDRMSILNPVIGW